MAGKLTQRKTTKSLVNIFANKGDTNKLNAQTRMQIVG